ncbi:hypothetical protein [Glycocaulis sp.]
MEQFITPDRLWPAARYAFALALAGLGLTGMAFGDFALQWQPVPEGIPGRTLLAILTGGGLVILAGGLVLRSSAPFAAIVLMAVMAVWTLLLHLPRVVMNVPWAWLGFFEFLAIAGAALILASALWQGREGALARFTGPGAAHIGLILFAVSTPFFGLSHLISVEGAARFVPDWLPFAEFWVVATGIGHAAVGLALLAGILTRLATALYTVMVASFVLTVHIPDLISDPARHQFWVMVFVALLIFAAVLTLAAHVWTRRPGLLGRVPAESAS